MNRLVTIPISHYCERARWALDYAGVPYREERHLQGFHARAVRRAGGRKTTPVLVTKDGALTDSADILAFADTSGRRSLYPDDAALRSDIEAFEHTVAGSFGVETRRLVYDTFFPERSIFIRYNNVGAPRYQDVAIRLAYPVLRRTMTRYLGLTPSAVENGRRVIESCLGDVDHMLADGRDYLFGAEFSAADLTFAAMLAPLALPRQYGVPLPDVDQVPRRFGRITEGVRDRPSGRHALAMYSRHRR